MAILCCYMNQCPTILHAHYTAHKHRMTQAESIDLAINQVNHVYILPCRMQQALQWWLDSVVGISINSLI